MKFTIYAEKWLQIWATQPTVRAWILVLIRLVQYWLQIRHDLPVLSFLFNLLYKKHHAPVWLAIRTTDIRTESLWNGEHEGIKVWKFGITLLPEVFILPRPSSWLMFLNDFLFVSWLLHITGRFLHIIPYIPFTTHQKLCIGVAHMVCRFGRTQPGFILHEPCTSEASICTVFADTSFLSNYPQTPFFFQSSYIGNL